MSDADATLNAECGEECCDYAYDKLEYRLERFFVFCVTHGIRSLKLLTWLSSPATFGAPPRCVRLLPAFFVSVAKIQHPPKINHTFPYVSCDSRIFCQISYKIILFTKHTFSVRQTETVAPRHSTTDVRIGRRKPKSHIRAHRFLLVGTFRLHVSLPSHELL